VFTRKHTSNFGTVASICWSCGMDSLAEPRLAGQVSRSCLGVLSTESQVQSLAHDSQPRPLFRVKIIVIAKVIADHTPIPQKSFTMRLRRSRRSSTSVDLPVKANNIIQLEANQDSSSAMMVKLYMGLTYASLHSLAEATNHAQWLFFLETTPRTTLTRKGD
jgi:hypothetical protein